MSPTGSFCGTIGWEVFGGSLKGQVCVGYAAFVVLAHSGCFLGVWSQGGCAKQWSGSPMNRWVFGLRCRSVRSIAPFVSCASWLQMGNREREMATGCANIVAVMGKKDNAGACPVGHGKAVEGYGTRAWVAPLRSLDLASCELD